MTGYISREKFFIDGRWVSPAGPGLIEVVNPATEKTIGAVPEGLAADIDAAVRSAAAAQPGWADLAPADRAAYCTAIAEQLAERGEELAALIASELGMPIARCRAIQVGGPVRTFSSMASVIGQVAFEEELGNSLIVREPVGVVGAITPWNYPLHQIAAKVAPAMTAGCTVVLKPSEVTPLNAFLLAEILDDVGFPPGC